MLKLYPQSLLLFFTHTPTTEIYTLSLHDALPISSTCPAYARARPSAPVKRSVALTNGADSSVASRDRRSEIRSEEHTSELQSLTNLVCRLLLEKKKKLASTAHDCLRQEPKTKVDA